MNNEIESVIKKLPMQKTPGPDNLTGEICETIEEELTLILVKLFQNIEEEGILSNSFYTGHITLIPKPDEDTTRKL